MNTLHIALDRSGITLWLGAAGSTATFASGLDVGVVAGTPIGGAFFKRPHRVLKSP